MAAAAPVVPPVPPLLAIDRSDLINVLDNVCPLTANQRDTLINDGYNTARSLVHWN